MAEKKKKKTWPSDTMPAPGSMSKARKNGAVERVDPSSIVAHGESGGIGRAGSGRMTARTRATYKPRPGVGGYFSRDKDGYDKYYLETTVKTPKRVAKDQLVDANKRAHKAMSSKMQENEKKRKASDSARANKRRAGGSRFKGR